MILLCHRFDNKGRRRKCGNIQRKKKKKTKNLKSRQPIATNQQNSMKTKTKKLKSRATHSHKLTKFHEQLKRRERKRAIYRNYTE